LTLDQVDTLLDLLDLLLDLRKVGGVHFLLLAKSVNLVLNLLSFEDVGLRGFDLIDFSD
jgi:hypothetical protein